MGRSIVFSRFVCEVCGAEIELPRKRGEQREVGHIKDVFCYKCKEVTKHDEIRFNDFGIRRDERRERRK